MSRAWLALVPLLVGMGAPEFRFHRAIEAAEGWTELEIPDDVLETSRPGLPDLRIRSGAGDDIPYADVGRLPFSAAKLPLVDVEVTPGKETTAVVDRGAHPGWANAAEVDVTETDFIKPVKLEASSDRAAWAEIAECSIFATRAGAAMTKIRFAPNDRRFWRFRFDDKNGSPIHPTGVILTQAEHRERPERGVEFKTESDADVSVSTYAIMLESANLPIVEVTIDAAEAAFSRQVRLFERVWFRDEVTRRLLGRGEIVRTADGRETTRVAVTQPTSKRLEIDVERTSGVPLHVTAISVASEAPSLLFFAPKGPGLELFYGSNTALRPSYDLATALGKGRPPSVARAKLGAPVDTGAIAPAISDTPRGGPLDLAQWKTRQAITLPARGPVAFLDLDRSAGLLSDVRIVDAEARQVPYVVEANPRRSESSLDWRVEATRGVTVLHLKGVDPNKSTETIDLEVTSPDYFTRDVTVVEPTADPRGTTGERLLGTARVVRVAGAPREPLSVAIAQPTQSQIVVRIADGDNAPLGVAGVRARVTRRRIDFLFAPGDRLALVTDNPQAGSPHYDLALVAEKVLSSPAEAASLGEVTRAVEARKKTPAWFWLFVLAAALVLFFAVGRALRQEPAPPP